MTLWQVLVDLHKQCDEVQMNSSTDQSGKYVHLAEFGRGTGEVVRAAEARQRLTATR